MARELEGNNQGGEKIQGIFEVWPPSFCDLHHVGGSCLGRRFWHDLEVDGMCVECRDYKKEKGERKRIDKKREREIEGGRSWNHMGLL